MKNLLISGLVGTSFLLSGFWFGLRIAPLPKAKPAPAAVLAKTDAKTAPKEAISVDSLRAASENMIAVNEALQAREQAVAAREKKVKQDEEEVVEEHAALDRLHAQFHKLYGEFQNRLQLVTDNETDQLQRQVAIFNAMDPAESADLVRALDDGTVTRLFSIMETKPLSKLVDAWKTKFPNDSARLLVLLNGMGKVMARDKIALPADAPAADGTPAASPDASTPAPDAGNAPAADPNAATPTASAAPDPSAAAPAASADASAPAPASPDANTTTAGGPANPVGSASVTTPAASPDANTSAPAPAPDSSAPTAPTAPAPPAGPSAFEAEPTGSPFSPVPTGMPAAPVAAPMAVPVAVPVEAAQNTPPAAAPTASATPLENDGLLSSPGETAERANPSAPAHDDSSDPSDSTPPPATIRPHHLTSSRLAAVS